ADPATGRPGSDQLPPPLACIRNFFFLREITLSPVQDRLYQDVVKHLVALGRIEPSNRRVRWPTRTLSAEVPDFLVEGRRETRLRQGNGIALPRRNSSISAGYGG